MLPNTLGGLHWTAGTVVAAGMGAMILLTSVPLAQYFALRDRVRRPLLWIPINVLAWLLGIAWTLAPSRFVDQSTPPGVLILVYSIAGCCMAATVAVITGLGMIRLLPPTGAQDQQPWSRAQQGGRVSRHDFGQPPSRDVNCREYGN
jgi:hypothetical protein